MRQFRRFDLIQATGDASVATVHSLADILGLLPVSIDEFQTRERYI